MTQGLPDFGTDLSCTDDLDENMAEVSGLTVVAQAIYRRLSTPRGCLWQDLDYGLDLRSFMSRALTAAELRSVPGDVRIEILKDERVESATLQVLNYSLFTLELGISVTTAAGPFSMVLSASQAAVVLSSVKEG